MFMRETRVCSVRETVGLCSKNKNRGATHTGFLVRTQNNRDATQAGWGKGSDRNFKAILLMLREKVGFIDVYFRSCSFEFSVPQ